MDLGLKTILWVAAGGACGALLRYAAGVFASRQRHAAQSSEATATLEWSASLASLPLPWATLFVNGVGCLAIGALSGAFAGAPWFESGGRAFLVTGLLGAFTTFSAFSIETLALVEQGHYGWASAYVLASVAICLGAAFIGYRIAGALA